MKLSKTSTHAALSMAFLASRPGDRPTQARHVAEHLGIPTDSALKVLQALVRHGLIRSQLGRAGGYLLARPAERVTLLQIIEAIDGPFSADVTGPRVGEGLGPRVDLLRAVCERATVQLRHELSHHTAADLALIATADATHALAAAG